MKKAIYFWVAFMLAPQALAAVVPSPSPHDARIRAAEYNPLDVVVVHGTVGIATHIRLAQGERYVDHAFGDAAGWHFAGNDNNFFLKPKAEHSDSNLILLTDRRVYYFELRYSANFNTATKMFAVSFTYPETEEASLAAQAERQRVLAGFSAERPINVNYTMTGKPSTRRSLAPINAWDNGQFTFFRFSGAKDIPAIFIVNPDGSEGIVNHHIEGKASDVVVVHKVAARWVFRLGREVLSIFNESYDPTGESNTSRTASPEVIRNVRGPVIDETR